MILSKRAIVRVITFLILVFGVSWALYGVDHFSFGTSNSSQGELLPLGMLMPAFIALLFDLFSDQSSMLYYKNVAKGPRYVVFGFFLLTLIVLALNLLGRAGFLSCNLVASIGSLLFILWTLLLIHKMRHSKPDDFAKAGLQIGDPNKGILIAAGVVIFFFVQSGLNLVFDLGDWRGLQDNIAGIPVPPMLYPFLLFMYLGIVIVGTPLGNMAILFGEEYAWRGFLLRELEPLGRRKGTLVIGVIWGLWHIPILLAGIHTYPPTLLGFILALTFFTLWSFVQSYVLYKVGSIWAAVFLHGIVNGVYAFMLSYLVYPSDKLFSFGLGVFGLVMLAVIVVMILRDPIWSRPDGDPFVG
jgi:membrane protease YdiL (CAAX protease family)